MQRFLAQESSSAGRRLASFAINPGWPEENLEQKFLDTAKKLAHFGWTIPPQMIPRELFELSTSSDGETVDAGFINFYRRTGNAPGVGIGSPRLRRWHPLLEQCLESYDRGNYLICVPALIAVLEGAIAFPEGIAFMHGSERKAFFHRKIADCDSDLLSLALWESMDIFVSHLFASAPFGGTRPPRLNRHWILHGRDAPDWRQADALRLFQALSTSQSHFPVGCRWLPHSIVSSTAGPATYCPGCNHIRALRSRFTSRLPCRTATISTDAARRYTIMY